LGRTDGGAVNNSGVPLTTWAAANSVANDIVLEQTATGYDADGNAIQTADAQRFNTDPTSGSTSKGALFTATTNTDGSLNVTPSSSSYLASRIYYTGTYYDAGDRDVADVNVGDNGGSTWSRPSSVPSRSDTVLVTSTAYNAAGWVDGVTDPRGIASQMIYDNLGRTIISVAAYDPTVSGGSPTDDQNQTTVYTYDPAGHTTSMTAYLPSAIQQTQYVYGVTSGGGSTIDSNDLLALVEYPDKSTGLASTSASDQNSFTYNTAGQVLTKTDQNGTVHSYTYDVLGRQTSDAVTVASGNPQHVDTTVLRITTNYDSQGNVYQTTSYNAASGGSIVNQVENLYNGLGQLIAQYQAVSGAVNTSTTPVVQYAYSDPSLGSRMVSMTYPNGRILHYGYDGTTLDTAIGRLSYLADDNGSGGVGSHLQDYQYLGLSTVVSQADADGITLTYIHQSGDTLAIADGGDQYTGLDRFGRVSDQNYVNVSTSTSTDRFQYGYDRDGNVLYKNNLVNSADSELYHANSSTSGDNNTAYDPLNRLVSYQRGTLSSSGNNGSSLDTVTTNTASQSYALDAVGNMSSVTTNGGTPQSRSANSQDQYTTVGGNSMTYDNNGNTTTDETGKQYVYDAWNRLVAVKDTAGSGGATLETFTYDGQGYRVTDTVVSTGTTTALYYSAQWQVLEERQSGTTTTQYVWSPTYVDAMLLRDSNATSGSLGISGSGLGQRLYVQQDANFNVTAIVNNSGAVQERYIYDPYGNFTVLNSSWSPVSGNISAFNWIYLHQGGRYDGISGLYTFEHRDYSPTLQRWMQQDPTGYADGSDSYEYLKDNSVNATDAMGLRRIVFLFEGLTLPFFSNDWVQQYWRPLAKTADPGADVHYLPQGPGSESSALQFVLKHLKLSDYGIKAKDGKCFNTIIIAGFSFGGNSAINLANDLGAKGVPVQVGITADPRWQNGSDNVSFGKPTNALAWINEYQQSGHFNGSSVQGAQPDSLLGQDAYAPFVKGTGAFAGLVKNPSNSVVGAYHNSHTNGYTVFLMEDALGNAIKNAPESREGP
jgi:RHS repeat-associated protein